jgi:hypothetical protein
MRTRVVAVCAALVLLAGCGGDAPRMREATAEDERAAEARIKEQAGQELKARKAKPKGTDPADKD